MPLDSGTKLGNYEIVGLLGVGGMGEVYRARDTKLDREVAIKVLPAQFATDAAMLVRFEREAKAIAALSHPNILAIHDLGTDEGRVYAVTELLDGVTLRERLEGGPLGSRKCVELGCQIARGLGAAHAKGIVHRDLKPENVMIAADGRAKILDFGLAARQDEVSASNDAATETPTRTSLTDPGTVLGTAGYMSPEQVRGQVADARSDIFSFGAVLYEVLTGKRAFQRETSAETMTAILREDPPEPAASGVHLSPALWSVVQRCLEKQPQERFSSAQDIAFALEAAVQVSSMESGAAIAGVPAARAKRIPWVPVAAGLLLAAIGFFAGRALAPGSDAVEGQSASVHLRQLTFDREIQAQPTISPDGKSVAYVVTDGPTRQIHLQRVGGTTSINLTLSGGFHPAFSPDGEQIAFATTDGVFVMGATGESARRVTDKGYNPAWSPDGRWLLVNDERIDSPYGRSLISKLWKVDVTTGERIEIEGQVDAVEGNWSPDGRRIAFWGLPAGTGKRVLFTMPAQGGQALALTDDDAMNWNPQWSPDGRQLYFASNRGGNMNLWRMPIDPASGGAAGPAQPVSISTQEVGRFDVASDGSLAFASRSTSTALERRRLDPESRTASEEVETLLAGSRVIFSGRVSPDGRWVAYQGFSDTEDLFVLATDGSGIRRLTNDPFKDRAPTWTGDSQRLFSFSTRSGRYEAWSIRIDGGDPRQITRTAKGRMYNPLPSHDGKRLLVHADPLAALIELDGELPISESDPLPPIEGDKAFFGTDWSPDDRHVVGTSSETDGIYIYSLDDRTYRRVSDQRALNVFWLPAGRTLIYEDDAAIWLLDLERDEPKRLYELHNGTLTGYAEGYVYNTRSETASDIWLLRE